MMVRPLALCYGTRPQVIKASRLAAELGARWPLLAIDTGQHYDYLLNELLYAQLGIAPPDRFLGVGGAEAVSHATQTAAVLTRAAEVFEEQRPRAVVVIGDTNSTLGCALAAAKMRLPVIHVEAGLRAADAMMAEEINRRTVDAMSALLCAPSRRAEQRLLLEHVAGTVVFTGDVARDVLRVNLERAEALPWPAGWPVLEGSPFALATLHRAELTDSPERLRGVLRALGDVGRPVLLATHPRTLARLERDDLRRELSAAVHLLPPFGYLETLRALRAAEVVITDSGGVQREAYWLGTPCITVRGETEWSETVECGANVLVPPDSAAAELSRAVTGAVAARREGRRWDRDAYGDGEAARYIAEAIAAAGVLPG